MMRSSCPLVSYTSMQFSDSHARHLETGLRLRNPEPPVFPSPPLIRPRFMQESSLDLGHLVASCTSYKQLFYTKYIRCGIHGIILHQFGHRCVEKLKLNKQMLCQCRLYSPSCATSVSPTPTTL